jgi:DNA-binding NarL/FixJ family response regulator
MAVVSTDRIPVAVCADDPLSRAGLLAHLRHRHEVRLLQEDEAAEGTVAIVVGDEINEDLLRVIRVMRRTSGARVVLMVSRLDDAALLTAVEAGAGSLLLRPTATVDAVIEAVRSAASGSGTVPPDFLGRLLEQVGKLQRDVLRPRGLTFSGLTEREINVLRLVAEGHDTLEIGQRLFFSERTVKNIIHDITTRLHLRNRTHAVAYALRQGLI